MKDPRILNYVELFFESVFYSKHSVKIKEEILKKLELLSEEYSFEEIVEKYNTLESLCYLASFSDKDIQKLKFSQDVITKESLQKDFKTIRKFIYLFLFFFLFGGTQIFYLICEFHFSNLFALFIGCFFGVSFSKKYLSLEKKSSVYSVSSREYLKDLYDKYTKKFFNTLFFSIVFCIFYFLSFYFMGVTSKFSEVYVFFNRTIFLFDLLLLLLFKNYFLSNYFLDKMEPKRKKVYFKNVKFVFLVSALYWFSYFLSCVVFKEYFMNCFLFFACGYGIFFLIFLFFKRKEVLYQNIRFNGKRFASFSVLFFFFFLFSFMKRDFWLLQPYINSVPNIATHQNKISYNEQTGVYTITNAQQGDFKVLQLTDIHLGGSIFSYDKDKKALETVYDLISFTEPDLVLVTGDLTFPVGLFSFSFNNHTPVMQFASFMRNLGIPWAFTYGNHDTEAIATYSEESLDSLYQSLSYKTSKNLLYPYLQPSITGRNNQLIEVRNFDGSLNQALILLDSNAYTEEGFNTYDFIHDDQVEWYQKTLQDLERREHQQVSSMLFFHIPIEQYRTAYELYLEGSEEVTYYFGSNDEKMFDKICTSDYETTLFSKVLELRSTKAIFCGHDHYNNMSLEYKGVRLTYGMSIDYLAMPGISKDTKQRGGTLITLKEDSSFEIEQIPYSSLSTKKG